MFSIRSLLLLALLWPTSLPVRGMQGRGVQGEDPAPAIAWVHGDLDAALSRAREEGAKGVAVYFWMDGSAFCARMYGETLSDPAAVGVLDDWACLSADVGSEAGAPLFARFSVTTLPAVLFLTPEGVADDAILGFSPIGTFEHEVQRIESGQGTVRALAAAIAAAPDDFDLRLQLALKLIDVGRAGEGQGLIDGIKKEDPRGETVIGARLLLAETRDAVIAAASDPADTKTWDLEPLEDRVRATRPREAAYEGWVLLARLRTDRGEPREAFDAWHEAADRVDENGLHELTYSVGDAAWAAREGLRGRDAKLALELARKSVERLETEAAERAATEAAAGSEDDPQPKPPPEEEEEGMTLADGLELLARAEALNGKRRSALETLERALALAPTSARLLQAKAELEQR